MSRSLHCKVQVSFMDVKCQRASVVQLKVFYEITYQDFLSLSLFLELKLFR